MPRITKAERERTFKIVMNMYGLATGFGHGEVYIDFYSYEGGYCIEMKNDHNHGVTNPFGGTRRNNAEFMAFLGGMRAAKLFEEDRRIQRNATR